MVEMVVVMVIFGTTNGRTLPTFEWKCGVGFFLLMKWIVDDVVVLFFRNVAVFVDDVIIFKVFGDVVGVVDVFVGIVDVVFVDKVVVGVL